MSCCACNQDFYPLCIPQGADFDLPVQFFDEGGLAEDLTGGTVYFNLKYTTDDPTALLTKVSTTPSQVTILTPNTDGKAVVHLLNADTSALIVGYTYVYDVWAKFASGKQQQWRPPSPLTIGPRVTVL